MKHYWVKLKNPIDFENRPIETRDLAAIFRARENFPVSALTSEGIELASSNLKYSCIL